MARKVLKLAACLTVFAVFGYVVLASLVLWYMPKRIAKDEMRVPAIQRAVAECAADQHLLSFRIRAVADEVHKNNGNKIAIVHGLLSDNDINRLALNYLGADFVLVRTSFTEQIRHSYALLKAQKDVFVKENEKEDDLKKKLRELESRKKFLLDAPGLVSGTWTDSPSRDKHYQKLSDIDSQLHHLRAIEVAHQQKNRYTKDVYVTEKAKLEKTVFGVCELYERKTIKLLERTIAERKAAFQGDIHRISMLRDTYDALNIWPLPALRRAFFN